MCMWLQRMWVPQISADRDADCSWAGARRLLRSSCQRASVGSSHWLSFLSPYFRVHVLLAAGLPGTSIVPVRCSSLCIRHTTAFFRVSFLSLLWAAPRPFSAYSVSQNSIPEFFPRSCSFSARQWQAWEVVQRMAGSECPAASIRRDQATVSFCISYIFCLMMIIDID